MAQPMNPWAGTLPPDLTIGPGAVWKGGREPARIAPDANPGGLLAVLLDAEDREIRRWILDSPLGDEAVEGAEAHAAVPGSSMVIYDGDSGYPVMRLKS